MKSFFKRKRYYLYMSLFFLFFVVEGDTAHVYISIGSFIVEGNAERFVERLEKAGFKTFTEKVVVKNKEFTRVTLLKDYGTYRNARRAIPKLMRNPIIRQSGLKRPWIRPGDPQQLSRTKISPSKKLEPIFIKPENYSKEEKIIEAKTAQGHTIINVGNAGVSTYTDSYDHLPLGIVQVIPGYGSSIGPKGPIIVFFNDRVYLPSISENFIVEENNVVKPGTITIVPNSNGMAIITYIPKKEFEKDSQINVLIKNGLQDDGGNAMNSDYEFSVHATLSSEGNFLENGGFEKENVGIIFQGDGGLYSSNNVINAPEGTTMAALSTGNILTGNSALMNTTSLLICGPIDGTIKEISFKYNLVSAEFNVYVGSIFDDSALLMVSGLETSKVYMITSINIAGYQTNSLPFNAIQGFPDSDVHNGITGWKDFTIKDINIKGPSTLSFILSDVGDAAYSSILFIDDVKIKVEKGQKNEKTK
ncbi:MAG: SPOR domain-containing protein [Spirochaetes bacterium]|nr:SPOR domain-containing protein [Spirochaetota bacterium]